MTVKLDKAKTKHSLASKDDVRIWWLEELEGELLAFAKYCVRKSNNLKGDETAIELFSRVGKSINDLKISSSLSTGTYQDLFTFPKEKKKNGK
jgi:hypothetical protein|tara:strand:+ start:709 stop:987 length:279 start_codon:yes stop_codon:yes gene_type:complete